MEEYSAVCTFLIFAGFFLGEELFSKIVHVCKFLDHAAGGSALSLFRGVSREDVPETQEFVIGRRDDHRTLRFQNTFLHVKYMQTTATFTCFSVLFVTL